MKTRFTAFAAVVLLLCASLQPAEAQQTTKISRVGFLAPQGRSLPLFDAFRQGLADLGYVEGRNVVIEARQVLFPRFLLSAPTISPFVVGSTLGPTDADRSSRSGAGPNGRHWQGKVSDVGMLPNIPEIDENDARRLVHWILSFPRT